MQNLRTLPFSRDVIFDETMKLTEAPTQPFLDAKGLILLCLNLITEKQGCV